MAVGAQLPVEILDTILRLVEDRADIKTCSLSCTTFRILCQARMFSSIMVDCDELETGSVFGNNGMVYSLVQEDGHTHITNYIRRLRIVNHYGFECERSAEKHDRLLGQFLRRLQHLEDLSIEGFGINWEAGSTEFMDGLVAALQLKSLTRLDLRKLVGFPMPLLRYCRSLRRLQLQRIDFSQEVDKAPSDWPQMASPLEDLRMNNWGGGISELVNGLLSHPFGRKMFSGLKTFHLDFDGTQANDSPLYIGHMLNVCQNSLENFEFLSTAHPYEDLASYVANMALGRFPNLKSFSTRVYFHTRDGYLHSVQPFSWLKALLNERPRSTSLRKLALTFFHRQAGSSTEGTPEEAAWNELDEAISVLPRLQEVTVVVCCPQCGQEEVKKHEGVYDLPLTRRKRVLVRKIFTNSITEALRS